MQSSSSAARRPIVRYVPPPETEDDNDEEEELTTINKQQQHDGDDNPASPSPRGDVRALAASPASSSRATTSSSSSKAGPAAAVAAAAVGAIGVLSAVAVLIVRRLKGSGKKCEQQRQGHANSSSSGNNTAKRRQAGGSLAAASAAPGPLSKLKPSATCVPTADGTLAVVKRPIAADNSCLFNAVGYTMHQSLSRAPFLRRVVSNEVSGDPEKWSDAFLGMPNASYCSWIADPGNWGGGIELAILAAHYRREIYAWNIETGEAHVFGEDAGHARAVMVLYNGVHYDALAITPAPQAAEWEDTTEFNPRTKRGRAIVEAARTLVALNGSGGAANKSRPTSRAGSSSTTASATTTGGKRRQRPKQQQPSLGRLRCTECSSILESTEAAKEHASATGHQSFEQLV